MCSEVCRHMITGPCVKTGGVLHVTCSAPPGFSTRLVQPKQLNLLIIRTPMAATTAMCSRQVECGNPHHILAAFPPASQHLSCHSSTAPTPHSLRGHVKIGERLYRIYNHPPPILLVTMQNDFSQKKEKKYQLRSKIC